MRHFLYYNQDSIDSFLAQIEQGLLLKSEDSRGNENSITNSHGVEADITGDLSAKVLGIGASLQGDLKKSDSNTEIATRMVQSIQEKALHDYAFDKIFEYLTETGFIKDSEFCIGDSVLLSGESTLFDFNYFQQLFADDGAIKLINDQSKKQVKDQISTIRQKMPRGNAKPSEIEIKIKELQNKVDNDESERKEIVKIIKAIRKVLPYNRFMIADSFLIPLTDKYLRDDPDIIAFKYGGKMSIFGYITNIIDSTEQKEYSNRFASLYDAMNQTMFNIFRDKERIYIMHPVTMYY